MPSKYRRERTRRSPAYGQQQRDAAAKRRAKKKPAGGPTGLGYETLPQYGASIPGKTTWGVRIPKLPQASELGDPGQKFWDLVSSRYNQQPAQPTPYAMPGMQVGAMGAAAPVSGQAQYGLPGMAPTQGQFAPSQGLNMEQVKRRYELEMGVQQNLYKQDIVNMENISGMPDFAFESDQGMLDWLRQEMIKTEQRRLYDPDDDYYPAGTGMSMDFGDPQGPPKPPGYGMKVGGDGGYYPRSYRYPSRQFPGYGSPQGSFKPRDQRRQFVQKVLNWRISE